VVVLPDNDRPGQDHAAQVVAALHGTAARARILNLPGLREKGGDVSDWLDDGHTVEELRALISPTLSTWTADALLREKIPEPRWAVPDLIPEGLCALGGRPKFGNSWISLRAGDRQWRPSCQPGARRGG
jgi:hypothetical protein